MDKWNHQDESLNPMFITPALFLLNGFGWFFLRMSLMEKLCFLSSRTYRYAFASRELKADVRLSLSSAWSGDAAVKSISDISNAMDSRKGSGYGIFYRFLLVMEGAGQFDVLVYMRVLWFM